MSISTKSVAPRPDIVDDALDAYVHWREECTRAREAYFSWSTAARRDRTLAHGAYVAALDREEAGARAYAEAMRRLGNEYVNEATPWRQ